MDECTTLPHGPGETTATCFVNIEGREDRLPLQLKGVAVGPMAVFSYDVLDVGDTFVNAVHQYEAGRLSTTSSRLTFNLLVLLLLLFLLLPLLLFFFLLLLLLLLFLLLLLLLPLSSASSSSSSILLLLLFCSCSSSSSSSSSSPSACLCGHLTCT